jgi:hypothetical protein
VALLLAFLPPAGVFALWMLPTYPREGKIAATVGAFLWMALLALAVLN